MDQKKYQIKDNKTGEILFQSDNFYNVIRKENYYNTEANIIFNISKLKIDESLEKRVQLEVENKLLKEGIKLAIDELQIVHECYEEHSVQDSDKVMKIIEKTMISFIRVVFSI